MTEKEIKKIKDDIAYYKEQQSGFTEATDQYAILQRKIDELQAQLDGPKEVIEN